MKISKLFHWLYAILMLLPVMVFMPSAFYYAFNKYATNETETIVDIQYKYQTNEVNSLDDLVEGNIYFATEMNIHSEDLDYYDENNLIINIFKCSYIDVSGSQDGNDEVVYDFLDGYNFLQLYCNAGTIGVYAPNNDTYINFWYTDGVLSSSNVYFVIQRGLDQFADYFSWNTDDLVDLSISDFNYIENVDVSQTPTGITSKVNQAWIDVWQQPLFSWASQSFLMAPFSYIANLFGMPVNSTILVALSYWLAISLIYLVFDLVMYVPLLVHRWIDKARIE